MGGTPIAGWLFICENPMKLDDVIGYPDFRKHIYHDRSTMNYEWIIMDPTWSYLIQPIQILNRRLPLSGGNI